MAEYIERGTFIEAVKDIPMWGSVAAMIADSIPTADVAPVTRCKDCKHYDMGVCLKIYSDGNVHPEAWQSRKLDDFCSYGERKDSDNAT